MPRSEPPNVEKHDVRVGHSPTILSVRTRSRALLDRTAEGGCPHVILWFVIKCWLGGPEGCGLFFKVDRAGKFKIIYAYTGPPHYPIYFQTLVRDQAGNLCGPHLNPQGESDSQKILYQFLSLARQHAFGMELHALDREMFMP